MGIEVNGISKFYGEQQALKEISFEINTGEIVGFLGPNGAGKSTTMKILTGYLPASEGIAKVNGLDIKTDKLKLQQQIGYLPEHNPLYLEMYVREYLAFNAKVYKTPKEEIEKAVRAHEKTQEYLGGREPKKVIVVPGKIVNFVG